MELTVVLPTHHPHPARLARTLAALAAQTLPGSRWELVIVDNDSPVPLAPDVAPASLPAPFRLVREPTPGLGFARRRGFREARGAVLVLVDDDNVLAPDYLERVLRIFAAQSRVGAIGGRVLPEFVSPPPAWVREFDGLLACRDLGPAPQVSHGLRPAGAPRNLYPAFAPVGAGMALRREAAEAWLKQADGRVPDRQGDSLTSGGDNEIVFAVMRTGWEVGYFPELSLTHLIPPARTDPDYLARLNEAIARSWVQVLRAHDACPWPAIAPWTVPLRKFKAWLACRAWAGPSEYIRWRGACGHFRGRAAPGVPTSHA